MLQANYFFFQLCDKKDDKDRSTCLLGEQYCHCAFFEAFFEKFEDHQEESLDYNIDPYEEYMLKRRYGDEWHQHVSFFEEEEDFWEDDLGLEDYEDDPDAFPF